jgi:hypothetical protein
MKVPGLDSANCSLCQQLTCCHSMSLLPCCCCCCSCQHGCQLLTLCVRQSRRGCARHGVLYTGTIVHVLWKYCHTAHAQLDGNTCTATVGCGHATHAVGSGSRQPATTHACTTATYCRQSGRLLQTTQVTMPQTAEVRRMRGWQLHNHTHHTHVGAIKKGQTSCCHCDRRHAIQTVGYSKPCRTADRVATPCD